MGCAASASATARTSAPAPTPAPASTADEGIIDEVVDSYVAGDGAFSAVLNGAACAADVSALCSHQLPMIEWLRHRDLRANEDTISSCVHCCRDRLQRSWRANAQRVAARPYIGKPFWLEVRVAAELCRLQEAAVAVLSADALYGVLSQLASACAADDVADALAAAQLLLHTAYAQAPTLRSAIRSGLRNVAEALAARVEWSADVSDALGLGSMLRLLKPIIAGMAGAFQSDPPSGKVLVLEFLVPLVRAAAAPKLFEAFSGPLTECVHVVLAAVEESDVTIFGACITVLEQLYSPTAHFRSAAAATLTGRVVQVVPADVFPDVLDGALRIISKAIASDVAAVALAGLAAAREGLVPFLQRPDASRGASLLLKAMAHDGKMHWSKDVMLEAGQLWQEVIDAVGSAGAVGGDDMYGERLLRQCSEEADRRQRDSEAAAARSDEAVQTIRSDPKLNHLSFVFGAVLGTGAFATVRFAKYIETGVAQQHWISVAVKGVRKSVLGLNAETVAAHEREVSLQAQMSREPTVSAGIVRLLATYEDKFHVNLVQELCPNGDMHTALTAMRTAGTSAGALRGKNLVWVQHALHAIAHTLHAMHEVGVMYGDVKPENVVVAADGRVKLCDFGSAMKLEDVSTAPALGGTADYLSWEVHAARGGEVDLQLHGRALDWWAFAVTTIFAVTGSHPFEGAAGSARMQRIRDCASPAAARDVLAALHGEETIRSVPSFVFNLLSATPAARGSDGAAVVLQDAFFADCPHPRTGPPPPLPPKLKAVSGVSTRNSGRKQSVMWRAHAAAAVELNDASTVALSVMSAERTLDVEPAETVPSFEYEPFALPAKPTASERLPSVATGIMTVMPRR
jgi:serine/threonine protein kinase